MLHQVGVGALGPVFRTYEPTRDRLVAVKVFRLDITPEQAVAFADELAKTAEAGLFHPSIVEPIAAGIEGSAAYRAEEYVAAETLDVAMRHYAPAPIEKVLPFITQLAGALDFARSAGVGHGALHPRDIFVTPEEARASGFGVVEALERVGLRAPVRRPYTAPERVAGEAWDARADVFSLGVIAYELMTGRRPSGTGTRIGTITGGRHAAAIHGVLAQAMDDDPARRQTSALAFASALDAASRGEQTSVPASAASAPAVAAAPLTKPDADADEDALFDDIEAERDDDEAHQALLLDDTGDDHAGAAARFDDAGSDEADDEAVEDLALGAAVTDRYADEFDGPRGPAEEPDRDHPPASRASRVGRATDSYAADVAGAGFAAGVPAAAAYDDPVVVPERRGPGLVPVAVTVMLALLVGFAAGYAIGRRPAPPAADATTIADSSESGTPNDASASSEASQSYIEEALPPAEPPVDTAGAAEPPAPRAADAPAAPTPVSGTVEVRSTPSNAGVTVDGRWRGRTPLTIEDLSFGRHAVRVVQQGYEVAREDVSLSVERPTRELSFVLKRTEPPTPTRRAAPSRPAPPRPAPSRPAPTRAEPRVFTGSLFVDSRPRGARVLVDGKFVGTTPARVPDLGIGSKIVRLELADHRSWTTTTRVVANQEARVTGSLERIR